MSKDSILFILFTYLLTFLLLHAVPNTVFLSPFVPGVVAILLTIYNRKKISSLFKRDSVKNLLCGLMIPLVTFSGLFGLDWIFSLITMNQNQKPVGVVYYMLPITFIGSFVGAAIPSISIVVGWQGYFLKRIRGQISNFYARGLLIGLFQGVFSAIVATGHSGFSSFVEFVSLPIICISFAQILFTSMLYTWLFERNDSIWSVVIVYSLSNAFLFSLVSVVGVTLLQSVSFSLLLTVFHFLAVLGIVLFGKPNRERNISKNCS